MTIGKYAIDCSIGPSRESQRAQAIDFIQTMVNSYPELMGQAAPELIELMNISGTEKLQERLQKLRGDTEDDDSPEGMMAAQQAAEMAQMQMQMEMRNAELELAKKEAEVQSKLADIEVKAATAESERAQAMERAAKAQQNTQVGDARMAEMEQRMALLQAQTEKIYAEMTRIMTNGVQQ
jgi:hypothetical protein